MTVRIPKWVLGVLAVLVVAGLALGAYLIGRSSSGDSAGTETARQLPCTNGSAERAVLDSDLPHFIAAAHSGLAPTPHPFFDPATGYTVGILRCADVTGDGQNDMVVGLGAGTGRIFNWAIFTPGAHHWSLAFHQEGLQIQDLKVGGGNVQEVQAIYGPIDLGCCPSGKRVSKVASDGQAFQITTASVKKPRRPPTKVLCFIVKGTRSTWVPREKPSSCSGEFKGGGSTVPGLELANMRWQYWNNQSALGTGGRTFPNPDAPGETHIHITVLLTRPAPSCCHWVFSHARYRETANGAPLITHTGPIVTCKLSG